MPRTDPVYNAHAYLTKIPLGAIVPLIERHCPPGGTVLDPFAGSGMTGVAAAVTGRRALLGDINELGRHVGRGFLNLVDPDALEAVGAALIARVRERIGQLYAAPCGGCGREGEIAKLVWSCVYACGGCGADVRYFDVLDASAPACGACGRIFARRTARRVGEEPVLVYVDCARCGRNRERPVAPIDRERIEAARARARAVRAPDLAIDPTREMYRRSALKRNGLESTAAFFSPRNLVALGAVHEEIGRVEDLFLREKLRFVFTAILPRASKRYQWSRRRPLNAQNQTYYVAPVFYEWNVLDLFARKLRAAQRSDAFIRESLGARPLPEVTYHIGSADALGWIPDASVDYVFTDPPFGSNIFYSDMSLFHEAWLGRQTDASREAVVTTGPDRQASHERYARLLAASLAECARVLKPGGRATVVFGNSRGEVWSTLQHAIAASGLEVEPDEIRILDKGQRSVKGLSAGREHVVTADLALGLRRGRGTPSQPRPATPQDLAASIRGVLSQGIDPASRSHVYLHVIRDLIRAGVDVTEIHLSAVDRALRALGCTPPESSI